MVSASGSTRHASDDLTLFLAGDVMTGRGVDQVLPHPGDPALQAGQGEDAGHYVRLAEAANGAIPRPLDFDAIWGHARCAWLDRKPEVGIVNLETAVTARGEPWPRKSIVYRMHPLNVGCLATAPMDVCVVGNNHVLDWGYDGLADTLSTLSRAGVATAGAGVNEEAAAAPAAVALEDGRRVLVFSWVHPSSHTPLEWAATRERPGVNMLPQLRGAAAIRAHIARYRRPGDVVVASFHWGPNWGHEIGLRQRWLARRLIDSAGVDLVHGHSSHHPMGIDLYRGRAIIYGCGDFINDYEGIPGHDGYRKDLVLAYFVRLRRSDSRLTALTAVPFRIEGMTLQPARPDDVSWLLRVLNSGGVARAWRARLAKLARGRVGLCTGRWRIDQQGELSLVPSLAARWC